MADDNKSMGEPRLGGASVNPGSSPFPTTRWTLVMRVREGGPVRQAALEELCSLYWYPVYAFLRGRGHPQHDAEDLTQGFFVKLLHDESLAVAEAGKGRLRTFLLQHLKRHMADHQRHVGAQKRGGDQAILSFEELGAEERYLREPVDSRDPERLFARAWAESLIAGVREQLRQQVNDSKRPQAFELLLPFLLLDDDPPSYRDVAHALQASEVSVRMMVHRLRMRFRVLLQDEIGRTVDSPEEAAAELTWLRSVLIP